VSRDAPLERAAGGAAGLLTTGSFLLGSAGLIVALAADAIAVAGRHLEVPFLGSIETVQAAMIVAASSGMVGATLGRAHATVHVVTERLPARARRLFQRVADSVSALFFAALAAGSIWLVVDLWYGAERTELLGLPLKALRLVWCASALLIAGLFAVLAFRRDDRVRRP
jgi:TRAP-type C4-dicarboxylate transport system permease small subunit